MTRNLSFKLILFLLMPFFAHAQRQATVLEQYHYKLSTAKDDTARMKVLRNLHGYYMEIDRDSSLFYVDQAILLARKIKTPAMEVGYLLTKAYVLQKQSNFALSFKSCIEAQTILQHVKNAKRVYIPDALRDSPDDAEEFIFTSTIGILHQLGNTYAGAGNWRKAIEYYEEEIKFATGKSNNLFGLVNSYKSIGAMYSQMGRLDSAFLYARQALENNHKAQNTYFFGPIFNDIGDLHYKQGNWDSARYYYGEAIAANTKAGRAIAAAESYNAMARLFLRTKNTDSLFFYAGNALNLGYSIKNPNAVSISASLLANAWKIKGNADSALAYLTISKALSDSLKDDLIKKTTQFQQSSFEEQLRLEKEAQDTIASRNSIRTIALLSGLALLSILVLIFYRNNRQKHKANIVLEKTLSELRSTQTQLIQSEKMASLGELTAGIAHEIQNPLNFVNNFSEVSKELLSELGEEVEKGNYDEVKAIAGDVVQNLDKIHHHGKRADAIVKSMLQHSRSSSGQKEPTDLNALCDEYLRLAYHGLRAKDNTFNATQNTDFDPLVGRVSLIPQDMGRVLLNLINNAFYAVSEKSKTAGPDYQPSVTVTTRKAEGKVKIKIADNGNGIPETIRDKIFQPFFTTKPTGQGTGLGLSLSYDIVKAHGGELKVTTEPGLGSTFIIHLPYNR